MLKIEFDAEEQECHTGWERIITYSCTSDDGPTDIDLSNSISKKSIMQACIYGYNNLKQVKFKDIELSDKVKLELTQVPVQSIEWESIKIDGKWDKHAHFHDLYCARATVDGAKYLVTTDFVILFSDVCEVIVKSCLNLENWCYKRQWGESGAWEQEDVLGGVRQC